MSVRNAAMSGTKPKYYVPGMKEISKIPWNGYNVISTFSGGGGSSLGYKMAGYHVIWANEFIPEARETYKANHPKTILDGRDIRKIDPKEVLKTIGMVPGEIDLLDGSPPCCAFSTAGARERGWGKTHKYSDSAQANIEDLFFEYIRFIHEIKPKVFVAENVSGLVKGTAIGYFKMIIRAMKAEGYNVSARLLNAAYLGVPQKRERLIFIGVRSDLKKAPAFPKPLLCLYTVRDALENVKNDKAELEYRNEEFKKYAFGRVLEKIPLNPAKPISGSSIMNGSYFNLIRESMFAPCSTICQAGGQGGGATVCHPTENRKFTTAEIKRLMSLPDDYVLTGTIGQKWERAARMVPPVMMMHIAKTIQEKILDE